METCRVTLSLTLHASPAGLACLAALAGCSSIEASSRGDKVDYRSNRATRTTGLEVPPDLTQLSRDSRYQQPTGVVSASTFQTATGGQRAATPDDGDRRRSRHRSRSATSGSSASATTAG